MQLHLTRPIVFFDLETTGIDIAKDRIVEISYIKVMPDGQETSNTMRINPGVHIPQEASDVHGITDADVKDCPHFKDVAQSIATDFKGCDIAGFNSNHFDLPMLVEEFIRAGVNFQVEGRRMVDVQNIYHKLERRTLIAAYKYYCGKDLEEAHSALADTMATYEVLKAQLDFYHKEDGTPLLENDVDFLAEFSRRNNNVDLAGRIVYNADKVPVFNFGKYKGMSIADALKRDPGYYSWMMNGDFPEETKRVLTKLRLQVLHR